MDLSKKEILFANGCSHVAGSEIEGVDIGWKTPYNTRWCFSGQLADRYGLKCDNIAIPGGCNHMIFRETSNWASKYISDGGHPHKVFMIIGWTTNIRVEFNYENQWHQWTIGADPKHYVQDFRSLFKHLTIYFSSETAGMESRLIYATALNRLLESMGFDHIMLNTYQNHGPYVFNDPMFNHLEKFYPFHVYFEPNNSFIGRYLPEHKKRLTKSMHADKYIHALYTNALDEYIKNFEVKRYGE